MPSSKDDCHFFNQKAAHWDTPQRAKRTNQIANHIVQQINRFSIPTSGQTLEIGSGTGQLALLLAPHFCQIDCLDNSVGMRQQLTSNVAQNKITTIHSRDESLLTDSTAVYDFIYSCLTFHHIIDIPSYLQQLKPHLQTNGYLLMIDLVSVSPLFHKKLPNFQGHDGFSKQQIETFVKQAGYLPIDYQIFFNGQKEIDQATISYELFSLLIKLGNN